MDETQRQIIELQSSNAAHLKKLLDLAQNILTAKAAKAAKADKADKADKIETSKGSLSNKTKPVKTDQSTNKQSTNKQAPSIVDSLGKIFPRSPAKEKETVTSKIVASTNIILPKTVEKDKQSERVTSTTDEREQYKTVQTIRFDDETKTFITRALSVIGGNGKESAADTRKIEKTSWWKALLHPLLVLVGGAVGLITGLMTDGPLKGVLKIIAQSGIMSWIKIISATLSLKFGLLKHAIGKFINLKNIDEIIKTISQKASNLFAPISNFFFKTVPQHLDKLVSVVSKSLGITLKSGLFAKIAHIVAKTILPNLKFIPIVGSLISFGFAASRYFKGDIIGGTIDLLSGIANLVAPITGPGAPVLYGVSVGLSVLNAMLDYKAGAASGPGIQLKKANILKGWLAKLAPRILLMTPLGPLFAATKAIVDIASGKDIKKSLLELAYMFPFAGTLGDWIGAGNTPEKAYEKISSNKFVDNLLTFISKSPPFSTIAGIVEGVKLANEGKWVLAAKAFGNSIPGVSTLIGLVDKFTYSSDKPSDIVEPTFFEKLIHTVTVSIKNFVSNIPERITNFIYDLGKVIGEFAKTAFKGGAALSKIINDAADNVKDSIVNFITAVPGYVKSTFTTLTTDLPKKLLSSIAKNLPDIGEFAKTLAGEWNGIGKFGSDLWDKVLSIISTTATSIINSIFDFGKIDKDELLNIGSIILQRATTFINTLVDFGDIAVVTGKVIWGKISEIAATASNEIYEKSQEVFNSIKNGITTTIKYISESAKNIPRLVDSFWNKITETFDNIVGYLVKKIPFIGKQIKSDDKPKVPTTVILPTISETELFTIVSNVREIRDVLSQIHLVARNIDKSLQSSLTETLNKQIPSTRELPDKITRTETFTTPEPGDIAEKPILVKIVQPIQDKQNTDSTEILKFARSSSDSQLKMVEELRSGQITKILTSINNILRDKLDNNSSSSIIPINVSKSGFNATGNSAGYISRNRQREYGA